LRADLVPAPLILLIEFAGRHQRADFEELPIADFVIMSGALFWYNRHHITDYMSKKKKKNEFIN
jgi:hypothetical protein